MENKRLMLRVLACLLVLATVLTACVRSEPSDSAQTSTSDTAGSTDAPIEPIEPTVPVDPIEPDDEPEGFTVSLQDGAKADIESSLDLRERIPAGTVISFTVTISAFYQGTPTVYAGEEVLTPNEQGVYSFTVHDNTVIRVEDLELKASTMEGEGTSDSPYLITAPVDMLLIAEKVNAGDGGYINAFYRLENDLDFEGEQMAVIGDGSTDSAVFAGYFNGNNHTISNYRIVAGETAYVGLFGVLQAETTGSGGGTITSLTVKDFQIDATATDDGAYVGGLVGYGMGGNLFICTAENGTVNVYANNRSFAFVGGLIGCQSALDYNGYLYYSSMSYCASDVDVNCNSGLVFAAGGLVGYMAASTEYAPAHIECSYSTGDIRGAMNTGGLVGYMTIGTSVTQSYSLGKVSAQTVYADREGFYAEYSYAYAGGLVGYAQAGSIVSECFCASEVRASSLLGSEWEIADELVAGREEPDAYLFGYAPITVYNCLYLPADEEDTGLNLSEVLQQRLNWAEVDWVFTDSYPTVNLKSNDDFVLTVTVVIGEETAEVELEYYMPLYYWYGTGVPYRMVPAEGSTVYSYGYFFDEQCTVPVPDSYVPTHDITLYAALADNADVAGEYLLLLDGDTPIVLTLYGDSSYTYTDAGETASGTYIYNGETMIFQDARFGRFLETEREMLHYQFYDFCATVREDGALIIVGGEDSYSDTYFTEDAPLVAVPADGVLCGAYTDGAGIYSFRVDGTVDYANDRIFKTGTYEIKNGALTLTLDEKTLVGTVTEQTVTLDGVTLTLPDAFRGGWSVDSKANKVFTFDGAGNWNYLCYGYKTDGRKVVLETEKGTYFVDESGVMTLNGSENYATAQIVGNVLIVKTKDGAQISCHRDGGLYGLWTYAAYSTILRLDGIGADGQGTARVQYLYSNGTVEFYDLRYCFDELDGNVICLYLDGEVFGFARYLPEYDLLDATIYIGQEGNFMSGVRMNSVDDLNGQWVGELDGLPQLEFNGYGAYSGGTLTLGEGKVAYRLNYYGALNGSFYTDTQYSFTYNEADETLTVSRGEESYVYSRKDAYGDLTLTDGETEYTFDGRGALILDMGIVYVNGEAAYAYKVEGENLRLYADGEQVGTLTVGEEAYALSLDGKETLLTIRTMYTGNWALSGSPVEYATIGTMQPNGKMFGRVNGKDVEFAVYDEESLIFDFDGSTFYAIYVGENNLVMCDTREWYLQDDYIECAPLDDMFGTWAQKLLAGAYRFDGMSNSTLTSGLCQSGTLKDGEFTGANAYYYRYDDNGALILWTTNDDGETEISRLNFCDVDTKRAFVNEDGTRAFTVEKGDRLYNSTATDEDGRSYAFDGFGTVTVSDGGSYAYTVQSIDYTEGVVYAQITIDGTTYQAIIDFSGTEMTITLQAEGE